MSLTRSGAFLVCTLLLAACGETPTEEGEEERVYPATTDSVNLEAGAMHGGHELGWGVVALNTQSSRLVELPESAAATRDLLVLVDRLTAAAGGPARTPLASLTFSECHPVITGYDGEVLRDTDGDGIPNDYKVDYGAACVTASDVDPFLRVTISGYRRLQDDGHGFRSFRATVKDLVLLVEYLGTGAVYRAVLNGTETGSFAAGGATYATDVTITEFRTAPEEPDREWFRHVGIGLAFTPGAGKSLALKGLLPDGDVAFQGGMQQVEPEALDRIWYDFALDTPTLLQWDPGCNGGDFTAGVFRGRYRGEDSTGFQLTWESCGEGVRELFGYSY
jgi:hypothetical protein